MKYIFFLFCYIAQFKTINSQCLYDSVVSIYQKGNSIKIQKQINYFDKKNIDHFITFEIDNFNDTLYKARNRYVYDLAQNKTTIISEIYNNEWQIINKKDNFSNMTIYYTYNKDSLTFAAAARDFYSVDLQNYKEFISQNFNQTSNKWENQFRRLYFYDNNLNNSEIIYQGWNSSNSLYFNNNKIKCNYSNNILIADSTFIINQLNYNFENSGYKNYIKNSKNTDSIIIEFDKFGNKEIEIYKTYYSNGCVFQIKNYSFRNNNQKQLELLSTYYLKQNTSNFNPIDIQSIMIYPNPTNSKINVCNAANSNFEIIEINGKSLIKGKILSDNEIINISEYNNGIYILKINNQFVKVVKN